MIGTPPEPIGPYKMNVRSVKVFMKNFAHVNGISAYWVLKKLKGGEQVYIITEPYKEMFFTGRPDETRIYFASDGMHRRDFKDTVLEAAKKSFGVE